jgi:Mg-chelatase subunit ChlD
LRVAETERLRNPAVAPVLVILTDGLANIDLSGNMRSDTPRRDALSIAHEIAGRRIPSIMIDTNPSSIPTASTMQHMVGTEESMLQPARELAMAMEADYYQLCPPNSATLLQRG